MACFFSFDGIDGVGKTTQIQLFCEWLETLGHSVVVCRDPGSTPLGERIREILLSRSEVALGVRAEMLLYMAARAQLVDEVIRPALAAQKTVIADRFLLANIAYQGYAGGLGRQTLCEVGRLATDGLWPTLTFLLDLDPLVAAGRRDRAPDRMEQRGNEFLNQVRHGFLAEAERCPETIVVIDASADALQVQTAVRRAAESVLDRDRETK
jgi:dTMP kinase